MSYGGNCIKHISIHYIIMHQQQGLDIFAEAQLSSEMAVLASIAYGYSRVMALLSSGVPDH